MYRYETHLHTAPVSRCARQTPRQALEFFRGLGYDGVFVTNHFIDGNCAADRSWPWEKQMDFYFGDYEEAFRLAPEIGIRVFCGVELSYGGTDFLIYGLDKAWYKDHPEIMAMNRRDELTFMMENGALAVQAHPYREASYIDHIRLFPRSVQGVETLNANRTDLENRMADIYAESYGLAKTAGSDIHSCAVQRHLAGMEAETPLRDEQDFIRRVLEGSMQPFTLDIPEAGEC